MKKVRSDEAETRLIAREEKREIGQEGRPMVRRRRVSRYYTIAIGRRLGIYMCLVRQPADK